MSGPDAAAAAAAASATEAGLKLRQTEDELDQAARRVDELAAEHDRAEAAMRADAAFLTPVIPALLRVSRYPVQTLLTAPLPPGKAIEGLLILRGLLTQARARAAGLSAETARLDAAHRDLETQRQLLQQSLAAQRAQSQSLDLLAARAEQESRRAHAAAEAEARRASAQAARKATLHEAVAALAPVPKPAPPHGPPAPVQVPAGPLPPSRAWVRPAAGAVAVAFGAPGDAGPAAGATLATPAGARVVSPCDGSAAFAQHFRSYGLLAIVDCGGGRHVVLAGLARLDVRAGQPLRAGQPVGVMPGNDAAGASRPRLYVELREGSAAINPAPVLHLMP